MVPIGEWRPDSLDINSYAREALNVIPRKESYGPLPGLSELGAALTARCQGAFGAIALNGDVYGFAGDATKLYKYNDTTAVWDDVTRPVGGAYATDSTGRWEFSLFGNTVIAVNGVDAPQSFVLGTSTLFAALAGSPPVAEITATVKDFAVLGAISTQYNRVKWSAINDSTDWTIAAATQSDQQDIPVGGKITAIVGTETGGVIFQERAIWQMTYVGPPVIFQLDMVSENLGTQAPGSVAGNGEVVFFLGPKGFMMLAGGQLNPIGADKVDRWFFTNFDFANRRRVTATIDYVNNLYVVGWPDTGDSGTPGNILFYHWPSGRWSRAEVTHDLIYSGVVGAAASVEDWDALFATLDAMSVSIDAPSLGANAQYIVSGFTTSFKNATFAGSNLAATVETQEAALGGASKMRVISIRPMVDGGTPTVAIGVRDTQQAAVTYGNDVAVTSYGSCPQRSSGRYIRAKIKIPAASTWTHAFGIDDVRANSVGSR